jgi:hypothetical protein
MAYKKADSDSFGEYQLNEGFSSAVTGKRENQGDLSIKRTARTAKNAFNALPKSLRGYENYPSSYGEYGYSSMEQGDLSTRQASTDLLRNAAALPGGLQGSDLDTEQTSRSILSAAKAQGYHGYGVSDLNTEQTSRTLLSAAKAQGYHGYSGLDTEQTSRTLLSAAKAQGYHGYEGMSGVEDDAFAGYQGGLGQELSMRQASEIARKDKISDDVNEFSGFGEEPMESWHTFFHQATLAKTDTDMLSALKKAVKAVPDDTPASVKRSYYDTAKKMMRVRKSQDLRYLDIDRLEIEANLGWLIDPKLPKTGGFNAILNKVVGAVGSKLGQGEKADLKMKKNQELGGKLREQLAKSGSFGEWSDILKSKLMYVGLGVVGLGAAYCYFKRPKVSMAKRKKKK